MSTFSWQLETNSNIISFERAWSESSQPILIFAVWDLSFDIAPLVKYENNQTEVVGLNPTEA